MRAVDRFKNLAANLLELPKDAIYDVPRVTLIGGMQAYIENHTGILEFEYSRIRLSHANGELHVIGNRLIVKFIQPREILIEGEISEIKFV